MNYKEFLDFKLSEIGIGTYLGDPDKDTSNRYKDVLREAVHLGINVVDTAINYRGMESERAIGDVIQEIGREKILLSTKGGYFPQDVRLKVSSVADYIRENFLDRNIFSKEDITPYGNILTPAYIDWSFEKSLENLKTDYVDVFFLHNISGSYSSYNIAMTEAYSLKNQKVGDKFYSTLETAEILGLYTYISAPLFQGRVLRKFPENVEIEKLPKLLKEEFENIIKL